MAPPEPKTEYSRGPGRFRGAQRARELAASAGGVVPLGTLIGGLLGSVILIAAEFTRLFVLTERQTGHVIMSVTTGSHNDWGVLLIGLLAGAMAAGVWVAHSRIALLALGALGLVALLIALLGDLPAADAGGLVRHPSGVYLYAQAAPSTGFYLESLGAVVLLVTSVAGFMLLGPPPRPGGGPTRPEPVGAPARPAP